VTDERIRRTETTHAGGHGQEEHSGGRKKPTPFAQGGFVVLYVLEDLECANKIKVLFRVKFGEVAKNCPALTDPCQTPPGFLACPRIGLDPCVVVSGGKADGESSFTRADLEH
jgi:hypothetical protein